MNSTKPKSITELKVDYVKYFEDVPVQRYAAMYIGRDEDTIIRWRKEDPVFAEAILRARAVWIRKKVIATKAEFALERLEREVFSSQNNPSEETGNTYNTFIQNNTLNPNAPEAKQLVDDTLEMLMERTRRQPTVI